jgi:hypothetical protein
MSNPGFAGQASRFNTRAESEPVLVRVRVLNSGFSGTTSDFNSGVNSALI